MFNRNKPGDDNGFAIPNLNDEPPPAPKPEAPRPPASTSYGSAPAPTSRSTNLSTLTAGVRYEGNISGGGDLQIDGALKGDVRLSKVIVGESGSVEGAVTGDQVEVRGRVNGSITGKSVRLLATARVEGDITQEQLAVEPGAWFQGRSIQAKRELPSAASLDAAAETEPSKPERYKPSAPAAAPAPAKVDAKP